MFDCRVLVTCSFLKGNRVGVDLGERGDGWEWEEYKGGETVVRINYMEAKYIFN